MIAVERMRAVGWLISPCCLGGRPGLEPVRRLLDSDRRRRVRLATREGGRSVSEKPIMMGALPGRHSAAASHAERRRGRSRWVADNNVVREPDLLEPAQWLD